MSKLSILTDRPIKICARSSAFFRSYLVLLIITSSLKTKKLSKIPEITIPPRYKNAKQVFHIYVIRCKKRDELQKYLKEKHISTGIHYPISLPKLEAYNYLGQFDEDFFAPSVYPL